MTLTFTIGDVYMPLPSQESGIQMEYFPIGVSGRTANATYRIQHIANKWRVRVTWSMLSAAERVIVWSVYGGYIATAAAVVLPDGTAFVGFVDLGSWVEAPWFDPFTEVASYNVSFTIVEA
jgi:hypothetical protein